MKSKIMELRDRNREEMREIAVIGLSVNMLKTKAAGEMFGCQFDTRVMTYLNDVLNNPVINKITGAEAPPEKFIKTMQGKIISSMLTELWDEDGCNTHYFSVDTMRQALQDNEYKNKIKDINKIKATTFYIDVARNEDYLDQIADQMGIDQSLMRSHIKWIDGMIVHLIRNENSDTVHFIEAGLCINMGDEDTSMMYLTIDIFDIDWNNMDEYRNIILKNCVYLANNQPTMRINPNNYFYDKVEMKS